MQRDLDHTTHALETGAQRRARKAAACAKAWASTPRRIEGSILKSDEWLSRPEAAAILGVAHDMKNFRDAWQNLVDAASAGVTPSLDDVPITMAACTIKGVDRWCIHRRHVVLLADRSARRERRWAARPDGWIAFEDAVERVGAGVDPTVLGDAWRALTKGTAYAGFERIKSLGVRFLRHGEHNNDRWLIHEEDVGMLAEAVQGRLPHLRVGYITLRQVRARTDRERRTLAVQALIAMAEGRSQGRRALLGGEEFDARQFLIGGKRTPCLKEEEFQRFDKRVSVLHAEALLRDEETSFSDSQGLFDEDFPLSWMR